MSQTKISILLTVVSMQILSAKPGFVTNQETGKEYSAVQEAVDEAAPSQTLIIGDGKWATNISVHQPGLIMKSENGPASSILDGNGQRIITWTGSGGRIEGFTLTNGAHSGSGSVLKVESKRSPDLIGNIISGNTTDGSLISECISLISGNVFSDNSAQFLVLNQLPGETVYENNVIMRNTILSVTTEGQLLASHANMIVRNNTIIGNSLPPDASLAYFTEGRFYNSIFWDNGGCGFHLRPTALQNCFVESTLLRDPPEEFNLTEPPDFVENSVEDPKLSPVGVPLADSPVLHAGNPKNAPASDILRVDRRSHAVSVGAYENP